MANERSEKEDRTLVLGVLSSFSERANERGPTGSESPTQPPTPPRLRPRTLPEKTTNAGVAEVSGNPVPFRPAWRIRGWFRNRAAPPACLRETRSPAWNLRAGLQS